MTRDAVLIFADDLAADLGRRRWPRRLAGLLAVPTLDGGAAWDVHLFCPRTSDVPAGVTLHGQAGDGFGERLDNAVSTLAAGYDRVVIVGRDCPQLDAADVVTAFASLGNEARLVLGPDQGGGCWLIGLNLADAAILAGVRWCGGTDFAELLARAGDGGAAVLSQKIDLDRLADARRLGHGSTFWRRIIAALLPRPPRPAFASRPMRRACLLRLRRFQLPPPPRPRPRPILLAT